MDKTATLLSTHVTVKGEDMHLHPYAGMYWAEKKILFVSDTHFGKVSHFRKAGMAVPMAAVENNWTRLASMMDFFSPSEVIILGDLFHSDYNNEWEEFRSFMDTYGEIPFTLVLGNHDILHDSYYENAGLNVCETLEIGPFIFSHHPLDKPELYNIYGHVHPAIRMRGLGRQSMKLPCFYFCKRYGIMPAFGSFTGTATIPVCEEDEIFVLTKNKVIQVSG